MGWLYILRCYTPAQMILVHRPRASKAPHIELLLNLSSVAARCRSTHAMQLHLRGLEDLQMAALEQQHQADKASHHLPSFTLPIPVRKSACIAKSAAPTESAKRGGYATVAQMWRWWGESFGRKGWYESRHITGTIQHQLGLQWPKKPVGTWSDILTNNRAEGLGGRPGSLSQTTVRPGVQADATSLAYSSQHSRSRQSARLLRRSARQNRRPRRGGRHWCRWS